MDAFVNSKFMTRLQTFAQKLGTNRYMSSLQASMREIVGVIICGSVFQILCNILTLVGLGPDTLFYRVAYIPCNFTLNLLGIYLVGALAYNYGKAVGCKIPLLTTLEALVCFLLAAGYSGSLNLDITYLGSRGMFLGFVVAFVVVQVNYFFQERKSRRETDSTKAADALTAVVSAVLNLGIWLGVSLAATNLAEMNLCALFEKMLSVPMGMFISVPGMFILGIFSCFLCFFGIPGTAILSAVLMPSLLEVTAANATIWQEGLAAGMTPLECHQALIFSPVLLFSSIVVCGGAGNTLPLCVFGLRAKSARIRRMAKIGVVPGWFGISEPAAFGMPVMYNPILFIPYLLNVLVVMGCTLLAYKVGILYPVHVFIGTVLPMGFAQFLGTFRWQNGIWDYVCAIPAGLIWYPFLKAYDNQLYAQEQAALTEKK